MAVKDYMIKVIDGLFEGTNKRRIECEMERVMRK